MMFKKDAITKLMNQYRASLPLGESFESRRRVMLEYIAAYYDNNRDAQELVARLNYLQQYCSSVHQIASSIAGVGVGLFIMYFSMSFIELYRGMASYIVYSILTAAVVYCTYQLMLFILRQSISIDPYLTREYEISRIKGILDEQVDEIVRMHLQLSFQNVLRFNNHSLRQ